MSKKPITWLELIKLKLGEEKAKGKSPSIGDVTPLAKKEWVQIKEGKHPLYIQGKAKTFARKNKGSTKTRKNSPKGSPATDDIQEILAQVKMCSKCKKKVEKVMKKKGMKGGSFGANAAPVKNGGNCGCGLTGGCGACSAM
jgi:hypothetical protein